MKGQDLDKMTNRQLNDYINDRLGEWIPKAQKAIDDFKSGAITRKQFKAAMSCS